jgi:hypothetical protein
MNLLPALVSPPFPTPSTGVGLGIRTAGSRDEPIVLPKRSGPTEVRRGEPSVRLPYCTHRPRRGCGRARKEPDRFRRGEMETARLLPVRYIPCSAGFKREEVLRLSLGWRGFFHGHRRGFLPRYLRCYPQLPDADRGGAALRRPSFVLHGVRPGFEAFGDPLRELLMQHGSSPLPGVRGSLFRPPRSTPLSGSHPIPPTDRFKPGEARGGDRSHGSRAVRESGSLVGI